MVTRELRSKVDKLWEQFWTGGITNPLTVIEQISFLMFARMLDMRETRAEKIWNRKHKGKPFPGKLFDANEQHLRWKNVKQTGDASKMLEIFRDELFPFLKTLSARDSAFGEYLKDAQLMIPKATLLRDAVELIDDLPLDQGDVKGDLYEYLLSKLTTAGINGQFRTPRHIIDLMVALVDPKPTEVIADPACGTAGFLVQTMQYLQKKYTSEEGKIPMEDDDGNPILDEDGEPQFIYSGDLLESNRQHLEEGMFYGLDFDVTMLRIAAMNMMLHDVPAPHIFYQDTLGNRFKENRPLLAEDHFDVILANPPFKGALDAEDVDRSLTSVVKTRKTELLFLALILRMLKEHGGRAAVVVPDGVLFGSSKAHVELRKKLVEDNQLEGVISLPSGVFKPYAGVSTAILLFTRGGETKDVFFYDVQRDGFSLDDKRDKLPKEENDLPDVLVQWAKNEDGSLADRKAKAFVVPKSEIASSKYDLSINRYKEIVYEEVEYDPPKVILEKLRTLEDEIRADVDALEELLG